MNLLLVILGLVFAVLGIVAPIVCILRTPTNLKGYYGKMFIVCAVIGVIAGISLFFSEF